MSYKQVLIVGYGSIGKRYGQHLLNKSDVTVSVVEPALSAQEHAISLGFITYPKLNHEAFQTKYDYAIVSNWGPDHVHTTNLLIENSIKRITIEKPFCNNLLAGKELLANLSKAHVRCNVHFRWPYINLIGTINKLVSTYALGDVSSINVIGGAGCLSTGGIHWMDLACRLFKANPSLVSGVHNIDSINPRSDQLGYVDGTCIYVFSNNKRLSFILDNNSSLSLEAKLFYKYGYISIDANSIIRVFKRDAKQIEIASRKITRYGIPDLQQELMDLRNNNSLDQVIDEMIGDKSNQDIVCTADDGFRASNMLILSLESSKIKKQIDFDNFNLTNLNNSWSIS